MTDTPKIPGVAEVRISGRTTRLIKIICEDDKLLVGCRVDRHGERWYRETNTAVTEELVVARPVDIKRRLVM